VFGEIDGSTSVKNVVNKRRWLTGYEYEDPKSDSRESYDKRAEMR
jgi:hypothetical protein